MRSGRTARPDVFDPIPPHFNMLTQNRHGKSPVVPVFPVVPQANPLPGPELAATLAHRNRKAVLSQHGANMGGHFVGALVV